MKKPYHRYKKNERDKEWKESDMANWINFSGLNKDKYEARKRKNKLDDVVLR